MCQFHVFICFEFYIFKYSIYCANLIKMKLKRQNKPKLAEWKKVKLSGPVISDDGGDLAGFLGLEILEGYNKGLLKKEKKMKMIELELDSVEKNNEKPAKKTKEKLKKRIEQDIDDDQPKPKKKKNENKEVVVKKSEEEQPKLKSKKNEKKEKKEVLKEKKAKSDDYTPGQFVLLKTPKLKNKKKAKAVEKIVNENNEIPIDLYNNWSQLGVCDPIIRALADKNYVKPTEIQSLTLLAAISGKRDILGAAETGSGKTLAFGIPLLQGIMKMKVDGPVNGENVKRINKDDRDLTPPPEELENFPEMDEELVDINQKPNDRIEDYANKPLYALILTPTRELAVQVHDHIKAIAKYTDIKIAKVFGGLAQVKQERILKQCPEIVIATPGRLWELIQEGNRHLAKIDDIKYLVIDETDRMLEKGHFDELNKLLERLNSNEENRKNRRNYIFSATLTMVHGLPEYLQKGKHAKKTGKLVTSGKKLENLKQVLGVTDAKVVDITQQHGTAQTLTESRILCKADHKDFYLYYFIKRHPGRTLVFCNSIDCVKRLSSLFGFLNCNGLALHGSMIQKQRLRNLEKFTASPNSVLFATDVAARGLDIPNVEHVIHYQVPKTTENYVHRSGRTARANKEGIAILLIDPTEIKNYVQLNHTLGRAEDLPIYPISDRMFKQVKERVNLARELETIELKNRRKNEDISWNKKVSEDFASDSDGKDSDYEEERKLADSKEKRMMKAKRYELSRLLATPLQMENLLSLKYPSNPIAVSMQTEREYSSAIKLVQKVVEDSKEFKMQRNKKRKLQ